MDLGVGSIVLVGLSRNARGVPSDKEAIVVYGPRSTSDQPTSNLCLVYERPGDTYRLTDQRAIRHCSPHRRIDSHRIQKLSKVQPIHMDISGVIVSQHRQPAQSSSPPLATTQGKAIPIHQSRVPVFVNGPTLEVAISWPDHMYVAFFPSFPSITPTSTSLSSSLGALGGSLA